MNVVREENNVTTPVPFRPAKVESENPSVEPSAVVQPPLSSPALDVHTEATNSTPYAEQGGGAHVHASHKLQLQMEQLHQMKSNVGQRTSVCSPLSF